MKPKRVIVFGEIQECHSYVFGQPVKGGREDQESVRLEYTSNLSQERRDIEDVFQHLGAPDSVAEI